MPPTRKQAAQKEFIRLAREIFPYEDYFGQWLGYRVEEMKRGEIVFALDIAQKHLSLSGSVHGGALSAFVDASMGFTLFTVLGKGKKCSTIEFKINYFSPVREGETIYARGKIKFLGRSHAVIESHVYREHEENKDIAMAVGTYNIY